MAKKKQQTPKHKNKSKKRKKPRPERDAPSHQGDSTERPRGLMSGMRSGMTDVAKGQSRWVDIFLWGLVILALCALAYRMGWIKDPRQTPPPRTIQVGKVKAAQPQPRASQPGIRPSNPRSLGGAVTKQPAGRAVKQPVGRAVNVAPAPR